jgi:hypothetical protein
LLSARSQRWQPLGLDEQFDAAGDAGSPSDQTGAFEGKHHLVDRRRRDVEVALQVGLGRRPAEHERIGMNEGEILALLVGEAGRACAAIAA